MAAASLGPWLGGVGGVGDGDTPGGGGDGDGGGTNARENIDSMMQTPLRTNQWCQLKWTVRRT